MSVIRPPTYHGLKRLVTGAGLVWFNSDRRFDLNLIVLRAVPGTLDAFDDLFCCAFLDGDRTAQVAVWPCSADPGKPSIWKPRRADGTAQLSLGQHRAAFTLGRHRGSYPCLVAVRALPVLRYTSAEAFATGAGAPSTSSAIQVHHAGYQGPERVGPWSEGCVVLQEHEHLAELIGLCEAQTAAGWGERFSLSVLPWAA